MIRVIIIGGGLAGLAGGVALAEAGAAVTLYERRSILGGRASSFVHPSGGELVDNCQHILLRCCTNLMDFYKKLGVENGIAFQNTIPFIDEANQLSVIRRSGLPVPFHLLPSFFRFKALAFNDKMAIGYGMLRMIMLMRRTAHRSPLTAYPSLSMLAWLQAHRQTDRAIDAFWRPILVSALNDELDDIDADYGIRTIATAFLMNRRGYEVGLPAVPLRDLYEPCAAFLQARGGTVELDRAVAEFAIHDGEIDHITFSDGSTATADVYLSAVPFDVLLKLLPRQEMAAKPYFADLHRLEVSPITAVHVWLDRQVTDMDYAAILGRTIQWVFNQTIREPTASESVTPGSYLGLVVSASDELMKLPQQEIVSRAMQDLRDVFPLAREAQVLKAIVVKEGRATFAPRPGCDPWRPGPRSPISNLFVSGDWTQTGWPATMESAVRSGYRGAEAILDFAGISRYIMQPDMPADGIMRLFL